MKRSIPFLLLAFLLSPSFAQDGQKRYVPLCVGFYNVENLYDTIDNANDDAEFLPGSAKQWGSARYERKVQKTAQVISELGRDVNPNGVAIIGLSEIENRGVLEDLVKAPALRDRHYGIVHEDSPDRRGVDVALLYDPKVYRVLAHKNYPLRTPEDTAFRTRDQLLVKGILDGDTVFVIVNHWPSRRGGEKRSAPKRAAAADLGRHIIDSLLAIDANARILYMGDLNDDPIDKSLTKHLRTVGDKKLLFNGALYDPMLTLYQQGIGSLAWQDSWNLFDQIVVSPALVTGDGGRYKYYGVRIYNEPYLRQREGNFAGYPFRTFVGDQYADGYSDHFPVYVILVREVDTP